MSECDSAVLVITCQGNDHVIPLEDISSLTYDQFCELVMKHFNITEPVTFHEFSDQTSYRTWKLDVLLDCKHDIYNCTVQSPDAAHSEVWTPIFDIDLDREVLQKNVYENGVCTQSKVYQIPKKYQHLSEKYSGDTLVSRVGYIYQKIKHGPAIYYDENGDVTCECEYHADRLHGTKYDYVAKEKIEYDRGTMHGIYEKYGDLPEEKLLLRIRYEHGVMLEKWDFAAQTYTENEIPNSIRQDPQTLVVLVGEPTQKNVTIDCVEQHGGFATNAMLYQNYRIRTYHESGFPKSDQMYNKGVLHGVSYSWWENGHLQSEKHYQHSKKEGISIIWRMNGRLLYNRCYHNDVRHGLELSFDVHGNIISECDYVDGDRDGNFVEYHTDRGQIILRYNSDQSKIIDNVPIVVKHEQYLNDVQNGFAMYWDLENNVRTKKMYYNNDMIHSESGVITSDFKLVVVQFDTLSEFTDACKKEEYIIYDGQVVLELPDFEA